MEGVLISFLGNNNGIRVTALVLDPRVLFLLAISGIATIIFYFLGEGIYWRIIAYFKVKDIKKLLKKQGVIFLSSQSSLEDFSNSRNNSYIEMFKPTPGNFMVIRKAINNTLYTMAHKLKYSLQDRDYEDMVSMLEDKKILTSSGVEKALIIDWMSNLVIQGTTKHVPNNLIVEANRLAWCFHQELNIWLNESLKKEK